MLGVIGPVGPQMEPQASQVHRPDHVGRVGHHQRVRRRAIGRGDHGGLEPVRCAGGHPLLEEGLTSGPLGEALEHGRTPECGVLEGPGNLDVVRDEIELRGLQAREVDLVGARDLDGTTRHLDTPDGSGGHRPTLSNPSSGRHGTNVGRRERSGPEGARATRRRRVTPVVPPIAPVVGGSGPTATRSRIRAPTARAEERARRRTVPRSPRRSRTLCR